MKFIVGYIFLFSFCSFIAFFHLAAFPPFAWDEAHNGVIALEMVQTNDFLNFHYLGEADPWVNKPPLLPWLIMLSYKLFGVGTFALRFPSALAAIITIGFVWAALKKYNSHFFAYVGTICFASLEAIIGHHVGRTGDFDSLFAMFTSGGIFFFFHSVETKEKKWIWVGGHFFFGAVLTKGIAIFLFLPAICLFAIHKKEIQKAFLICLFPILGFLLWAVAITIWGLERSSENYGSGNMLETMWLFDTWGRLTGANDFPDSPTSRWEFFLVYLDLEFRFVGYLLPLGLVFYLVQFIRSRKSKPTQSITFQDKDLLNFSLLVWIIPVVVLTLAKNKFSWYLAPVSPMLFIFIITLAKNYFHKNLLISILILFTVFGLGKKWNRYSKPPAISSKWLEIEKDIRENNRTCIFRGTKPDLVLWLKFQHPNLIACEIQD